MSVSAALSKMTARLNPGPLLVGAALGLAGCVSQTITTPNVNEVTVQIEGTVSEAGSGLPIGNAVAEVRTVTTGILFAETTSDSTGAYALTFLYRYFDGERNFCPFLFIISAPGYVGDTPTFQCIETVQTVDVQLQSVAVTTDGTAGAVEGVDQG